MKYEIELSKDVQKFLAKHENVVKRFFDAVDDLRKDKADFLDIRPLKGEKNHFRLRIGKYRFLYAIIANKIVIYFYDADSRGDIYK